MNKTLIVLVVALAAALGLLGKVAWDKRELHQANSALNEQLMQAKLEIGRAQTQFGDAQKYASELEQALQDELKSRNAQITRYGKLVASYEVLKKSKNAGEVIYIQGPKVEGDKFVANQLYLATNSRTLVPINGIGSTYSDFRLDAKCGFMTKKDSGPIIFEFDYNLHLRFAGELVETLTPSGAINHYFNLWELDDKNQRINKLKITNFAMVVKNQTYPHFYWWAPHLDVGMLLSITQQGKFRTGGSLGISFMGYGLTRNDLAWRFPRLSIDLSGTAGVGFTPVQHNLGEYIPLISNLWFGPHFTYLIDRKWMLGFMIGGVL